MSRRASWTFFVRVRNLECQLSAYGVGELSEQVMNVRAVEPSVSEFVDDGEEEANRADGLERLGLVETEDTPGGTEEQGGLNAEQWVFLFLESGDDEAIVGPRACGCVGQLGVEGENGANVGVRASF